MEDVNVVRERLSDMAERSDVLKGIFDYADRKDRLAEVELELAEPSVWDNPDKAQALGRERAELEAIVSVLERLESGLEGFERALRHGDRGRG